MGFRIIACSVGRRHLHAVVRGPDDYGDFTKLVGRAIQAASHAARHLLSGKIWAGYGGFKPVRGVGHLRNSYKSVRTRQDAGTVVWSHRTDEDGVADATIGIVVMRRKRDPIRIAEAGTAT